ncbi:hypothetical protein ANN_21627 [Periplaneta americana]|uniref:Uncharacterized protein n=1 Tax=Periplaneta americana TaxID=6978 RepID=A0ABQ8S6B8_PERAM|nr:hypothetical protein ANN_21627 [Periplaneta americana]
MRHSVVLWLLAAACVQALPHDNAVPVVPDLAAALEDCSNPPHLALLKVSRDSSGDYDDYDTERRSSKRRSDDDDDDDGDSNGDRMNSTRVTRSKGKNTSGYQSEESDIRDRLPSNGYSGANNRMSNSRSNTNRSSSLNHVVERQRRATYNTGNDSVSAKFLILKNYEFLDQVSREEFRKFLIIFKRKVKKEARKIVYYSLTLDDSSDITDTAKLEIFVRGIDQDVTTVRKQCFVQCVLSRIKVVDDRGFPSEATLVEFLEDSLKDERRRIASVRKTRDCFQHMRSDVEEDNCEYSKKLADCLGLIFTKSEVVQ